MNYGYELRKALFYNDFERTRKLIESKQFSTDLLKDCGDCKDINVPTPIYYITQLWNEILPGTWPSCQDVIEEHFSDLRKITYYFENELKVPVRTPIDIAKYVPMFTYHDYSDPVDEFLLETRGELNKRGFKDLDIDLFCAGNEFNFEETERLLELGADDTVNFDPGDNYTLYACMNDDFDEREVWQSHTLFPNPNYNSREYDFSMVKAMFRSVAKQRMLELLDKYYEINHPDEYIECKYKFEIPKD